MEFLQAYKNKTIVFSVLNWGLGHATRSIPIIYRLIKQQNNVIIISDGEALVLLKKTFPKLKYYQVRSYGIRYHTSSIWINIARYALNVLWAIFEEHKKLKKIVLQHTPDFLISDSRFGCYNKSVRSIIISHQVQIHSKYSFISFMATKINLYFLNRFYICWIMDDAKNSSAGKLSSSNGLRNHFYIGRHSRLVKMNLSIQYDLCIVLSGPEPMRTRLEKKLIFILKNLDKRICFVKGKDFTPKKKNLTNIEFHGLLNTEELNAKICQCKFVICRSGYSSIMDLLELNKKAILIPTPGQTEQIYLAKYHSQNHQFVRIEQKKVSQKSLEQKIAELELSL